MSRSSEHSGDDLCTLERYVIPNLRNASRILKLLAQHVHGLTTAEIARVLDIPVTTTLRILATFQLEGLACKADGRLALGPALVHLGNAASLGTEISTTARPILRALTRFTEETSHLAVPCDDRALIVAVQDSPHPLRASSRPGFTAELHCSATGKCLLAFVHHRRLTELYRRVRLPKRTAHTQATLVEIHREIGVTQKRGYSLDDEEFHVGVRCLAAPVYSAAGAVVAAIGITASTTRFTRERIREIATHVTTAARELSSQVGFRGAGEADSELSDRARGAPLLAP